MHYFFVSPSKVRQFPPQIPGVDLDAVAMVTRPGALPEGTPFFVGDDMRPREPITSYLFDLAKCVGAESLEDYAYDVMALEDFLGTVLDPPADLLSATEDDLVAYRRYRTALQPSPVRPATWRRNRVSIDGFYDWAVDTGLLEARPYRVRRNGRDALSGGPVQDLDVRHLTHRQWVLLHRVGLGGDLPDGSPDPSFRGGDRLRNMAAGELAVTSGMRLREFSCLLDIEVAAARPDREPATVELQAIAKYGFARQTVAHHPVLRSLDLYRRTERAAVVARNGRALWARRAELFVVDSVDTARMRLSGYLHGRRRSFAVAAMSAGLRRITVIEGARGLEPMALFVGRGGRMIGKSRWEQIFTAASDRARRLSAEFGDVVMPRQVRIHDLRHTFAVYMLKILTLQLVRAETERLARGGPQAYLFEHIARAPLLVLQRLLGHRDPRSTMKYLRYLEDLSAIVAQAAEEWTRADRTFADYALLLAGRGGL